MGVAKRGRSSFKKRAATPFTNNQNPLPRAKVAELSEIVLAHSMEDPIAAQILTDSVDAMIQLVTNTLRRLDLTHLSYSLVMSGGVLCNYNNIVDRLLKKIEQCQLAPKTHHVVREPNHGPLVLAAQTVFSLTS